MSARPVQTSARTPEQIEADAQWERYLAERANAAREAARIAPRIVVILVVALALVLALALANRAHAQEAANASWHLVLHGLSHHTPTVDPWTGQPFNGRNAGVGLRYQFDDTAALQVGLVHNSYARWSLYGLVEQGVPLGSISAGAFAALATNYPELRQYDDQSLTRAHVIRWGVRPGAGVYLREQTGRLSITVRHTPNILGSRGAAFTAIELGVQL